MRNEEIKSNFAKNIKFLRESKKMTQQELGNALGYSDRSISKWEKGDVLPDVVTLDFIANYFSLSVNDLIGNKTIKTYDKTKRHLIIALDILFGLLCLASIVYFVLNSFTSIDRCWLIFVYVPALYFLVLLIISGILFDYKVVILSLSSFTWSLFVGFSLTFNQLNVWLLLIPTVSLQLFYIVIGIGYQMYLNRKKIKHIVE